ncbi:sensor histidine kinase NtrY-like [Methylovirgula sp. 4M-Z18]|uniref:sensor histidine kinase NtrY-like n=1 Tax=Methylovirgula sp. 4M-Z18 TaxID=2293567 RepID=UPI000E2F3C2D|nr:PAS domain-containing sensor histidine kinase [Methylovirgula sp. 4M-Z18]RFB80260.1 PAS domain-containing sensor histidine kinase [Methylovirgula sp. 4M-Z18]
MKHADYGQESGPRTFRFGLLALIFAVVCAAATLVIVAGFTRITPATEVNFGVTILPISYLLLAANGLTILVMLGLLAVEVTRLIRARRAQAAAARLHIRIVAIFALIAAIPALVMTVFGAIILDRGLNAPFMQSMSGFVQSSVDAAKTFEEMQCRSLIHEADLTAGDLSRGRILARNDNLVWFKDYFTQRIQYIGFATAAIMSADGKIEEQVGSDPKLGPIKPNPNDLADARNHEPICIVLNDGEALATLRQISADDDTFLYAAVPVDPSLVQFSQVSAIQAAYSAQFDETRKTIIKFFAFIFALFALILLLSAMWLGLSFATRLVTPIRRLIHAADQVSEGNLYVQVPIRKSEGDLAHLGQTFNKMTSELRRQHNGLVSANRLIDERRLFTEAVLAGVPAAVVGLNQDGVITAYNPSAEKLISQGQDLGVASILGTQIADCLPELAPKIQEALAARQRLYQGQLTLQRQGRERIYNVRVAATQNANNDRSLVVTMDDMTELVTAQRTSAWADVARRIAHEIKNPLTPIALSAERLRRKYGRVIVEDKAIFDQCVETIVRQVDDIKRMVDEFSSFARMPRARPEQDDLVQCVRQVLFERRLAHGAVTFTDTLPDQPLTARFDRRLLTQALTNIVKNAAEGIVSAEAVNPSRPPGHVWVKLHVSDEGMVQIDVIDNGVGFPKENRQRLLEPYMTTRTEGTGLGLPIVAKILEDHGGGIELLDAPPDLAPGGGACVRLFFPAQLAGGADNPPPSSNPLKNAMIDHGK